MSNTEIYNTGFIDGCFDLFHYGHINAICQSKSKCTLLRVATHSNAEIYNAKKCNPVYNFEDRIIILKECKFIDLLDIESTPYDTTVNILNDKECDIFFHGEDGIDKYPLLDIYNLNKLSIFDRTVGVSTSDVLKRLLDYSKRVKVKTNTNIQYLISLYNNVLSLSNKLYTHKLKKNYILVTCNWDLFNKKHINLLKNIKKKYGDTYNICIDLSTNYNYYCIFNTYETRVLLAGISIVDLIILDDVNNINCTNLVLINSDINSNYIYTNLYYDYSYSEIINDIEIYKNKIISNINFDNYKSKISKIL